METSSIEIVRIIKWWLSHLTFTLVLNLVLLGAWNFLTLFRVDYLKQSVRMIDTPEAPRMICYTSYDEELEKSEKLRVAKN